jgi:hypothetical protein
MTQFLKLMLWQFLLFYIPVINTKKIPPLLLASAALANGGSIPYTRGVLTISSYGTRHTYIVTGVRKLTVNV